MLMLLFSRVTFSEWSDRDAWVVVLKGPKGPENAGADSN